MKTQSTNVPRDTIQVRATEPFRAPKSLARCLRATVDALAANPGDECLVRILCRHVIVAVRRELFYVALKRQPWYDEKQCQWFVEAVFEQLCAKVLCDAQEGGLDYREPVAYLIRLVNQVAKKVLDREGPQNDPLALHMQFHQGRYIEGLDRAMAEMDESARELVYLQLRLALDFSTMAEILNLPESAVQHRFKQAIDELKVMLSA